MSTQIHSEAEILNVTLTDADTEYSAELPEGTVGFSAQSRNDAADVRLAFQPGRVANASTGSYFTVKGDQAPLRLENRSASRPFKVYLASGTAGAVVEILFWR